MNALEKLLDFLARLEQSHIYFDLKQTRSDTIMVMVQVPGQHWEVEFFGDGHVEVEVYQSRDGVESEESLAELFEANGEKTQGRKENSCFLVITDSSHPFS